MKNKNSTRAYSDIQEKSVCKALNATQTPNSGAGLFYKGDCVNSSASILIECKTCMKEKDSFSIKKEWLIKNKEEAFSRRLSNHCLAFNFGPNEDNYYIINEKLMKYLVNKLEEEYKD